ncbi:MAG: barstar family protein [Planctomycetia bacterium]|nr:barstar family protein [Planctomycetia bacterium]
MAAFDPTTLTYTDADGQVRERLDWVMLRCGPVALFRKPAVLTESVAWLERHGYTVAQVDCERSRSEQEVLWAIGEALGFHRWPYPNLDGFNDDCRGIKVPTEGGFAVVLHRFDAVAVAFPEFARQVLGILARASWDNLLLGRRLLCLVRSEDPWIQFGRVGGHEPWWNQREWFNADRA